MGGSIIALAKSVYYDGQVGCDEQAEFVHPAFNINGFNLSNK